MANKYHTPIAKMTNDELREFLSAQRKAEELEVLFAAIINPMQKLTEHPEGRKALRAILQDVLKDEE